MAKRKTYTAADFEGGKSRQVLVEVTSTRAGTSGDRDYVNGWIPSVEQGQLTLHPCRIDISAIVETLPEVIRLRSEHATAVGLAMTSNAHKNETERLLIAEREKTARLRSLVEEAGKVVENTPVVVIAQAAAEARGEDKLVQYAKDLRAWHPRARSLLTKLKEG